MAHPYKSEAMASHKAKTGHMGKSNNLDIPVMRAVGENSPKKLYSSSSSSQQHKDQGAAPGMKRGGHVGKHRHSKPKVMVVPDVAATPPSPDPSMAAAGAGPSPAPAPPMPPPGPAGPPVAKRGGRFAKGGRVYPKHGGAENGDGRLDLSKLQASKGK
jgi:hypothetical protein